MVIFYVPSTQTLYKYSKLSFSLDIIFAACLIANSSLLNSSGLTPDSTSKASRPVLLEILLLIIGFPVSTAGKFF